MRKHLLSNWINILGTIIGLYCIILSIALQKLMIGERGLIFETVFIETIGGSFIYTYGVLIQRLIPLLIYAGLLIFFEYVLLLALKGKANLTNRINIEIIIFSTLFISYAIKEEGFILLIFPFVFFVTQQIRKKNLMRIED